MGFEGFKTGRPTESESQGCSSDEKEEQAQMITNPMRCDQCRHFIFGTDSGSVQDDTGLYGMCGQVDIIGVKAVQLRRPEQNVFVGPQIVERGSVYVKPSFGCNQFEQRILHG